MGRSFDRAEWRLYAQENDTGQRTADELVSGATRIARRGLFTFEAAAFRLRR